MLSIDAVLGDRRVAVRNPDDAKFAELILYVALASEDDAFFGVTKLNKILFFADFRAYQRLGHAITDQEYQRLPQGPAPRRVVPTNERLTAERALIIRERGFYGNGQQKPIALRIPDISAFTAEEIAIVDAVIREWWGRSAAEMSRSSHEFVGWQLAKAGETIPYEAALVEVLEPTDEEIAWARELEVVARDSLESLRR